VHRFLAVLFCIVAFAGPLRAQRIAVETLTEAELWKTGDSSRLLTRNGGRAAVEAGVHAWLAIRLASPLELRAIGYVAAGNVDEQHMYTGLELLELRLLYSRALVVEAGKLLFPMGSFGARRFSNTNPLIGAPDMYPPEYPWGAEVSGAVGALDYRAALVSLPAVNTNYTPEPGQKLRPVIGLGVSAGPSLHIGGSFTTGPYLGPAVATQVPAGPSWDGYKQAVFATDARFSAGYVEARAEAAWSSYDVPTVKSSVDGFGWYGELRVTLAPRVFVAGRYENYAYPFVLPVSQHFWVGKATRQMNGEVGLGYRLTADALMKTSIRRDHWPVQTTASGMRFPDGYALALQFSLHTDVIGLIQGRY